MKQALLLSLNHDMIWSLVNLIVLIFPLFVSVSELAVLGDTNLKAIETLSRLIPAGTTTHIHAQCGLSQTQRSV